ncbi:MAG: methyltransferase domain-containing protein [Halobacteriovoraceae bacterium]|jgi:arsenite methyltransferase|nr:methyltransferase domain-containing protein [Halobacteriovoraceae bacterium]
MSTTKTKEEVKDYYGKVLQESSDLKTNACCTGVTYPDYVKEALKLIHDEVHARYYGCGLTIPHALKNCKTLDLGSGAGRDCYILSHLVGEEGQVIGIDMTDEQLEVANRHLEYHQQKFKHKKGNTSFVKGDIENLKEVDLKDDFFDVIVSNCVINLATDKDAVLEEAFRVLKAGGELYFSDVYSDRRVPAELVKDPVLYGECLSGALYWNDFINIAKAAGFADPRAVEWEPITIENAEVQEKVGDIKFYSITYRLFKLKDLEPACEDYGQSVTYLGNLPEATESFVLDSGHTFKTGKETPVCGNTYRMLNESRFRDTFEFRGTMDTHRGIFEGCGESSPIKNATAKKSGNNGGCC